MRTHLAVAVSIAVPVFVALWGGCASPPPPAAPSPADPPPPASTAIAAAPVALPPAPLASAAPIASAASSAPVATPPPAEPGLAIVDGTLPGADTLLAEGTAGVRACIAAALDANPKAKGNLVVDVTVGSSGYVLNPNAKVDDGLPKTLAACAKKAVKDLKFNKPEGKPIARFHGEFKVERANAK